jgi:hypothetical protein
MNDIPIRNKHIVLALILALLTGIYTDYLASSQIGLLLCGILACAVLGFSLLDFKRAVEGFFLAVFMLPVFPRNLIDVQDSPDADPFYSLVSSQLLGLSLAAWLIILLALVALLRQHFQLRATGKGLPRLCVLTCGVLAVMYLATLFDFPGRDVVVIKEIISDHRFFLILGSAIIVSSCYIQASEEVQLRFTRLVLVMGMAIGMRAVFFFVKDRMMGTFNVNFAPVPYLLYPVVYAVLQIYRLSWRMVLMVLFGFAGAFSISRGDMGLGLMLGVAFIVGNLWQGRVRRAMRLGLVGVGAALAVLVMFLFNERAFGFVAFKVSTVATVLAKGGDMAKSPAVRFYEAKNILAEEGEKILPLLIGKGFGANFTFQRYPIPFPLDGSDYTFRDIQSGRFFRPHLFINYTFLKGGLLFFLFYLYLILLLFVCAVRRFRAQGKLEFVTALGFYFPIFAINMFWQIHLIFIFGFLLLFLMKGGERQTRGGSLESSQPG